MGITSRLHLNRLVAPSQIQTVIERIGGTELRWEDGMIMPKQPTLICLYLHFTFKKERRMLQYFFSPSGAKDQKHYGLSLNLGADGAEVLAAMKGAFGGDYTWNDEDQELEPTAGMEDILRTDTAEDILLRTLFVVCKTNCEKAGYHMTCNKIGADSSLLQ